ncbi:MAG: Gfo/Idh/MocA family protein [Acidimicrobiales bacterium]
MPLGVAVVGTGFGCLTHVRALRAAGFEVRALVGRDAAKTKERAERFDVPNPTTSLDAALAEVDAVTIATPPHTHAAIALAAIERGKHVLCEKPFAADAAEAQAVLAAAETAGIVHLLGAEFRWATGQALMTRVVAGGEIGRPLLATFLLHIPLLADPAAEVPDWWSDASQGGGWLGAHASHVIDQIRSTLGEFDSVSARLPHVVDRTWTAEDTYTVQFRMQSGADGILQSSAADWGPIMITSRIAGSSGTVWAEGDVVQIADNGGTRKVPVPADLETAPPDPPPGDLLVTAYDLLHSTGMDMAPWTRMAVTFRDLILGRAIASDPAPATFADGVALMRVLDAIRASAADGRWVTVSRE